MDIRFPLLLIIISILGYSCCTQKECASAFDSKEIQLDGFSLDETSDISICSYSKGSGFTKAIDSAFTKSRTYSGNIDDDLIITVPIVFNSEFDYKLFFHRLDLTYEITEISTISEKCNDCFLTSDNYIRLASYKVNGRLYEMSSFLIEKLY
ncbi:hypothetical protein [Saccharicrinis fermentans]|uniref:Uncharacterized protein n=1 Tax=Saccharicrinis fermentans DSM 9555 = JCM 21142 TaxID=869213 RepID=W7YMV1_9BACT|nr:hypothetical protein [Saccharicrinis fermentans]GAF06006.1 hypothetical protein JCM21142_134773 [Saccharicrinis fermentans DSM 9555 = JCM 21142]